MGLRQRNCPICGRPVARTHHCNAPRTELPELVRMPADFRDRIHPKQQPQQLPLLEGLDR